MRRAPAVLLSLVLPVAVVALPVVGAPHPRPHPVAAQVHSLPLMARQVAHPVTTQQTPHGVATHPVRGAARSSTALSIGADVLVSRPHVGTFSMLGVTWAPPRTSAQAPARLAITVRTHDRHGWGAWTALDPADPPSGPDARSARPGTEPLWVGRSDGVQVRVRVTTPGPTTLTTPALPAGLRLDLVDPGSSSADSANPAGAHGPALQAQAAAGQPTILSRSQWGADESLRRSGPSYNATIKEGFVHHTAGTNGYTDADVPKIIRGIYAFHVRGNGWSDIGYNFLVDRFGRLWEGRYGGIDRAVIGAHTGGFNVDSFAVSAIGNYDTTVPAPEMLDAIARLMAWKLAANHRDPNGSTVLTSQGGSFTRYRSGTQVTFATIAAHRDAGQTSCPGNNLYAALPTIRALTASYLGTSMFDPSPSPATATYGSGATITTTARVTSDQTWTLQVTDSCRGTLVRTLTGTASPTAPIAAAWDLRDTSGRPVRPGGYSVTLTSGDALGSVAPWTGRVSVQATATRPPTPAAVALPGAAGFVPVDPIKVYDTRAEGALPLGPGGQVTIVVPGAGRLPSSGIGAVALSIASSCATTDTAVTAWPAGGRRPSTAAVDIAAGTATSGLAVTSLGANGAVSISNAAGSNELTVHVVGYYPTAGGQGFHQVRALRIYDSQHDPAGMVVPGTDRSVRVPTLSGIPSTSMTGALLNITTTAPSGAGTLTVQSASGDRDNATTAYAPRSLVRTRAVARLQDGTFTLSAHGAATHVVVDLVGWWAAPEVTPGRLFQARAATRVLDTRYGIGVPRRRLAAGGTLAVTVAGRGRAVPGATRAVVLQLTARNAYGSTYVTAWGRGQRKPLHPDLLVPGWRSSANLVVVPVGTRGRILLAGGPASTDLVAEVVGYYR